MSVLGETLYNERIKQGLTVSDISKKTNIREYYIVAIEEGQFDKLPGSVYARGFIYNYAKIMGLDADFLISEYKKELNNELNNSIDSQIQKKQPLTTKETIRLRREEKNTANKSFIIKLTILVLIIAIIGFIFVFFKTAGNPNENVLDLKKTEVLNKNKLDMPLASRKINLISVKILAKDKCWTEAEIDGKKEFYGMLNKGQEEIWNGKKVFIKVGNINAIDIYVNNEKYRPTEQEIKNTVVEKTFYIAVKK